MSTNIPKVVLSIVSHGQLKLIDALLSDLERKIADNIKIVVTINIPEDESILDKHRGLPMTILRNTVPKGFGGNHNAAFRAAESDIFVVVNPDIRISAINWDIFLAPFAKSSVGACAPLVLSTDGTVEDSARRFPTLARLFSRVVFGKRGSDFAIENDEREVDWAAGMFVAYRSTSYAMISGFDERYYMYMEDADICRRLRHHGWKTIVTPKVSVVHDAQRASRRSFRHLSWHVGSAFRFLFLANA
jgi:GT2 family glycosyltransferase